MPPLRRGGAGPHDGAGPRRGRSLTADRAQRGWTTVRLLDAPQVEGLRRAAEEVAGRHGDPAMHISSIDASRRVARTADLGLKRLVGPAARRAVPGTTPFLAAFITKGPGGGWVDLHQDWTYTDERFHRATLLWCPLVDVDAGTGALHVVDGSHRWSDALRGSGTIPGLADDVQADLWRHARPVPLAAGEALVYDPALVHGSTPTDRTRPVVAVALHPTGSPLVHFHRDERGRTRGGRVDEAWFTTHRFGTLPDDAPEVAPWTSLTRPLAPADVDRLVGGGARR